MKLFFLPVLIFFTAIAHANDSPFDFHQITNGTVFNYKVKDGLATYTVKATITSWQYYDTTTITWQTTGNKIMKGTTKLSGGSMNSASSMRFRLKPGKETCDEEVSRWFIAYEVWDGLTTKKAINATTDGILNEFETNAEATSKDLIINNKKETFEYTEAKTSQTGNSTTIGMIEYSNDIVLMTNYSSGNYSIALVSIIDPLAKTVTDIMESLAPKSKVQLKKMNPAKFAKVRINYPLLATIENYDPTNKGKVRKPITETYEYRSADHDTVPPSLIDCLTADIKLLANHKEFNSIVGNVILTDHSLPQADAEKLLNVYVVIKYDDLPGYRPWSNSRFVNSLTPAQRVQLSKELANYISEYGFTE